MLRTTIQVHRLQVTQSKARHSSHRIITRCKLLSCSLTIAIATRRDGHQPPQVRNMGNCPSHALLRKTTAQRWELLAQLTLSDPRQSAAKIANLLGHLIRTAIRKRPNRRIVRITRALITLENISKVTQCTAKATRHQYQLRTWKHGPTWTLNTSVVSNRRTPSTRTRPQRRHKQRMYSDASGAGPVLPKVRNQYHQTGVRWPEEPWSGPRLKSSVNDSKSVVDHRRIKKRSHEPLPTPRSKIRLSRCSCKAHSRCQTPSQTYSQQRPWR